MPLTMRVLLPLNLFLVVFITRTLAFQCYVCDSKDDIECTENLPADFRLTPQDCRNITGAKYCIKTTNLYAGELGTKRFCAANDHGNRCDYVKQPTGDREYRGCVLTCDSENCNGSIGLLNRGQKYLIAETSLFLFACYISLTLSYHEHNFLLA